MFQLSRVTFRHTFASACTDGRTINVNTEVQTGPDVAREPVSRLSTSGPLLCTAATTRDFSGFTAVRTIVGAPRRCSVPRSSKRRSMLLAGGPCRTAAPTHRSQRLSLVSAMRVCTVEGVEPSLEHATLRRSRKRSSRLGLMAKTSSSSRVSSPVHASVPHRPLYWRSGRNSPRDVHLGLPAGEGYRGPAALNTYL